MERLVLEVGPTSGGAGASAASAESNKTVYGRIERVCIEKSTGSATPPATTDLTISAIDSDAGTDLVILTVADNQFATPTWYFPVQAGNLAADASGVSHWFRPWIENRLKLAIAQSDDNVTLKLTFYIIKE